MQAATDFDLERERLMRRRRIAEATLAESQRPMTGTDMVGGIAVRRSPTEGVGQIAKAMGAQYDINEADRLEKELSAKRLEDTKGALSEYQRAVTPRAAVASALQEDASGNAWNSDARPAFTPGLQDKQNAAYGLLARLGGDPRETAKLVVANALKDPAGGIGKIEPKDYTPESFKAYLTTGDFSQLRPVRKMEFVNGQAVDAYEAKPGTVIAQAPTEIERELLAAGMTRGSPEWLAAMNARVQKQTTHQPATTVNVSTEKKYGEQFGGLIAKSDVDLRDSAMKAPDLAERANRVKEVIAGGKVITGTGADYRLALGKALNLAGASDAETITNTETLATNLAQNTLDAIKASGLGSGSGFSNADRDFLEKAVGGKINLEPGTINRLADLSHRAAEKTAERWSTRVQEIPETALTGTGVKRDAIKVAPLFGATAKPAVSDRTRSLLDKYAPETR